MNLNELMEADAVLAKFATALADLPEEQKEAVSLALMVQIVRLTMASFAKSLHAGLEPYDALVAAVRGDLPMPEDAQRAMTVLRMLAANPAPDPKP